jgi:hypothetical protein
MPDIRSTQAAASHGSITPELTATLSDRVESAGVIARQLDRQHLEREPLFRIFALPNWPGSDRIRVHRAWAAKQRLTDLWGRSFDIDIASSQTPEGAMTLFPGRVRQRECARLNRLDDRLTPFSD